MHGPPLAWPRGNAMLFGPRPDAAKQFPIKPRPSQIMQQAGNLILDQPFRIMAQAKRNRRTHACGSKRMRAIVSANYLARFAGVGIVVETEELGGKGAGN